MNEPVTTPSSVRDVVGGEDDRARSAGCARGPRRGRWRTAAPPIRATSATIRTSSVWSLSRRYAASRIRLRLRRLRAHRAPACRGSAAGRRRLAAASIAVDHEVDRLRRRCCRRSGCGRRRRPPAAGPTARLRSWWSRARSCSRTSSASSPSGSRPRSAIRRSARSSTDASRKTLRSASGSTTVPMSRPATTIPPAAASARWRSSRAARTSGTLRHRRHGDVDGVGVDVVGRVVAVEQDAGQAAGAVVAERDPCRERDSAAASSSATPSRSAIAVIAR